MPFPSETTAPRDPTWCGVDGIKQPRKGFWGGENRKSLLTPETNRPGCNVIIFR